MSYHEVGRINFYWNPNRKNIIEQDGEYVQVSISPVEAIIIRKSDDFLSDVDTPWDDRKNAIYKQPMKRNVEIMNQIHDREMEKYLKTRQSLKNRAG